MATKDSIKTEDDSLESFINLSHALYEESNIKGLDFALLQKNRERIEQEQKAAESLNRPITGENEAAKPMVVPKAFATTMAKQIFHLIASSKKKLFEDKREHFARDRMVFEFDTSHDFLNARFYEHIPTKIFRSAEDCEVQEKTLKLDIGSIELTKRAKESFANIASNSDFALVANWAATTEEGAKIEKAKKQNRGIHIEKSDSEDIFDDAGPYVFQPMTQPITTSTLPNAINSTKAQNPISKNPTEITDKKSSKILPKKAKKQPNRPENHRSDGREKSDSRRERHRRSSTRRKKSRKPEKSDIVSHRRPSRRHRSERSERRERSERAEKSKRAKRSSPRYSKRRRRGSERASPPQSIPKPQPAAVLANETRRNWAPRAELSIYQRAKAEFGEVEVAEAQADGALGLGRALRDAADPYSTETRVEAFGKSALAGDEGNKKTSGFKKFGGRKKGSKGSKKNTKYDTQWKKIQERLG